MTSVGPHMVNFYTYICNRGVNYSKKFRTVVVEELKKKNRKKSVKNRKIGDNLRKKCIIDARSKNSSQLNGGRINSTEIFEEKNEVAVHSVIRCPKTN